MATITPDGPATDNEKVITVMAEDLSIKGTVAFKSSLRIEGSVEGEIVSEGLLVIAPTASIVATISTKKLVSEGKTEGDVTASEQVMLKKNSVHTGSITTPNLVVESGSILNGPVVMTRAEGVQPVPEVAVVEIESATESPADEPQGADAPEETSAAETEPVAETKTESESESWSPKQPTRRLF